MNNSETKCPTQQKVLINGPDGHSLQITDTTRSSICDLNVDVTQDTLELQGFVRIDATNISSQITTLILTGSQLSTFPKLEYASITSLVLNGNPITSDSLQNISMLPTLRWLDVSETAITKVADLVFPDLLTDLWMDNSTISSISNIKATNLKSLSLTGNKLSSMRNLTMPNIQKIWIDNQSVSPLQLPDFAFPTTNGQQVYIDLNDNPTINFTSVSFPVGSKIYLQKCGLKTLDGFPTSNQISTISLAGNNFTSFPQFPQEQDKIEEISMRNNQLRTFSNVSLPPGLTQLNMSFNQFTSVQGVAFPSSLRSIDLLGNNITFFELSQSDFDWLDRNIHDTSDPIRFDVDPQEYYDADLCQGDQNYLQLAALYSFCVLNDTQWNKKYPQTFPWGKEPQTNLNPPSANPTPSANSSHNQLTAGSIVAIVVGCIVIVAIITFGLVMRQKHKRKRFLDWDEDPLIMTARIPLDRIHEEERIGKGGFGQVFKGAYKDQPVAIKKLLPEHRKDMKHIEGLMAEVKLMASMDHPNIVALVGVAWDGLADLCVVVEYMTKGDLRGLLDYYHEEKRPQGISGRKLRIAEDIANGLTYLHSLERPVLHRDLKSRNVLLSEELKAKLTDFGISREASDKTMTAGVGTMLWMAPEVMQGGKYDEKADIFSFGVVLSELDTHGVPYAEYRSTHSLSETALLQQISTGTARVEFSQESTPKLLDLALACVSLEPDERPTAAEVTYKLGVIAKEMKKQKYEVL